MGIFSRFQDIVNANITALLDRAEDPKKMIRLMIQEMEETLVEVRTTSARVIADKKELKRRVERLHNEANDWESKAKLAISKGREDLARGALLEKANLNENTVQSETELALLEEHLGVLNEEIAQLQQKLKDAKSKQNSLLVREKTNRSRMDIRKQINREALNDAFDKFERYERRMDDLEGQVEAFDLGGERSQTLADEIEDLDKNEKVDEELLALKTQLEAERKEK
ncbi:phage shock protein PspA [Motiliproteus sp. MSK22-1]|uniref:phage shock protein PspA n=1 Tax=Motiliproteus sp. MSK22-1 TaxID=1897630 RepID=UPI0009789082|nr:phage shock protein PspA [Motiliproteus sp. MSK22-1]OMH25875.1 phage shock protein PspA [Motiliproteus sp. MSK22-1]